MNSRVYDSIKEQLQKILQEKYNTTVELVWSKPPSSDLGDISFPLFNVAKETSRSPQDIGQELIGSFSKTNIVEKIELKGGFLNLFLNRSEFTKSILLEIISSETYGKSDARKNERIIVEHTSANPISPLHIGNIRNSILGDVIGRMYKFLGAAVNFRYYVNDLGRQIGPVIIGYFLLKNEKIEPDSKVDIWIGKIYALMNTFYEIFIVKKDIEKLAIKPMTKKSYYGIDEADIEYYESELNKVSEDQQQKERIIKQLHKLNRVQNSLKEKLPQLYRNLKDLLDSKTEDLEEITNSYLASYFEGQDELIKKKFREVTESTMSGHSETLKLYNIQHDDFDWESEVAWSGEVDKILSQLDANGFLRHDGKALLIKNDLIASQLGFKEKNNIKHEIPDLILVNSEGVALYPCRDIAYHLNKLEKFDANYCINVIGKDQQLAQLSVRTALYGLEEKEKADSILHYDYEIVTLEGEKMAGREFEYVTCDELLELAKIEVDEILESRNYSPETKKEIASKVSISSIRYSILKIDPQKAVDIIVKKAVDPNENSGPFLQYSYARALNILEKAPEKDIDADNIIKSAKNINFTIKNDAEWKIINLMEELPHVISRALELLKPDTIANYAFSLASAFHKFYDACPVLQAEDKESLETRIAIVHSFAKSLESLFEVMGIDTLEKM
jgi:arginyl-tRNA synthetase